MWSELAVTYVCARWGEGYTASQISRKLNCDLGVKKSRNAIIGRLHRMGFTRSDQGAQQHIERRANVKRRAARAIAFVPNRVLLPSKADQLRADQEASKALEPLCFDEGPRTILTVRERECRYMAGEGADAPLCGRATGHGPWCSQHIRLLYQPSRKREREQASIERVTRWLDRKVQRFEATA